MECTTNDVYTCIFWVCCHSMSMVSFHLHSTDISDRSVCPVVTDAPFVTQTRRNLFSLFLFCFLLVSSFGPKHTQEFKYLINSFSLFSVYI